MVVIMDSITPEMTDPRLAHGAVPILPPLRLVLNTIRNKSRDPEFIFKRLIDAEVMEEMQNAQSVGSVDGSESVGSYHSLQCLEDIQYIYACLGSRSQDPTEEQVRECFGMPMREAAAALGLVSTSALRRVCRKYGIAKWPREKRASPKEAQTEPSNKRAKTRTKWINAKPIV